MERCTLTADKAPSGAETLVSTEAFDVELRRAPAGATIALPASTVQVLEGALVMGGDLHVAGAIIALDPHTGRVLAMSGGYDYEMSEFNRAVQAQRQPGSAFKPFVYLAALDRGYVLVELLKQGQYVPISVADQVAAIYAATNGHMDGLPIENIHDFEEELLMVFKTLIILPSIYPLKRFTNSSNTLVLTFYLLPVP